MSAGSESTASASTAAESTADRSTGDQTVGKQPRGGVLQPVLAGVVSGLAGWTSSFAVVLTGLRAVGADPAQAASGLMVVSLTMGLGGVLFSWRLRMPITMAWSTPGAALLASTAVPAGGFAGAVGAFVLTGLLIMACGAIRPLGRLVGRIPTTLANAMLAGVLLTLCVVPFTSLAANPAAVLPVLLTWLVLVRLAPRWAVPGALVAALVMMGALGSFSQVTSPGITKPVLVVPVLDPAALVAVALPLFVVTMTSQNIAGMAVLATFGYRPAVGPPLLYTGAATALGALGGGHAINLAAISAALAAGDHAHPDPRRRWPAGVACGLTYLLFGIGSGPAAALAEVAPAGLIASVAGLALVGTFASAGGAALADAAHREAAAVTFLVAASGFALGGIGGAFWGLAAGVVVWLVLHHTRAAKA